FSVDGTPIRVLKNAEHLGVPFPKNQPMKLHSTSSSSPCKASAWLSQEALDTNEQEKLKWVQKNYMVYNYCTDTKRFPQGLPP
ncbi:probable xyloglucan endotransglucosylase/hydrolase protein 23, partial [Amborella trichopoda]|uniref:probable xyloglucan endotransglucosylase/hydrolase protein 23 n=1 Tax=Amborella trichopoda TaxID=13333 RepID=UPI0009C134B9